jgi:hypothetical protein
MILSAPIPQEVWGLVLPFAKNPIPLPLSMPDRSVLRQPHLVSAMLTCKVSIYFAQIRISKLIPQLFHTLCVPLLYTNIVPDRFDKLLYAASEPNQKYLYSHTKSLHIEYCHKGIEPTYLDIFEYRGRWAEYDPQHWWEYNDDHLAEWEGYDVISALSENDCNMSVVRPALRTVAVSSIYGQDAPGREGRHVWRNRLRVLEEFEERGGPNVEVCMVKFEDFLASGDLRHLCIREPMGPLSLPEMTCPHERAECVNPRSTTTIHFGQMDDVLAMTLGSPIRWVSDFPQPQTGLTTSLVCVPVPNVA